MYVSLEKRSLYTSPSIMLNFSIEFILLVRNMRFYVVFLTFRCDADEFFVSNIKDMLIIGYKIELFKSEININFKVQFFLTYLMSQILISFREQIVVRITHSFLITYVKKI